MAITTAARRKLTEAVTARYQEACAEGRSRILDEFVALTGFHRKHEIRVLNRKAKTTAEPGTGTATAKPRARLYDEAVRQAVVTLWEASDRICGKRLRPLLPILVPALESRGNNPITNRLRRADGGFWRSFGFSVFGP